LTPEAELERLARRMRAREWERAAYRRWLRRPEGRRYQPAAAPQNRVIAEATLVREPIPNSGGAEIWITYHAGREEFLRMREDPVLKRLMLSGTTEFLDPDALNGYVAFPKRRAPRIPGNHENLVQYIPVHGGVTYARKDSYAAVWGFDTMHHGSEQQPRTDRDWIRGQCLILFYGLRLGAKLWPEFRRAPRARRVELAQGMFDLLPGGDARDLGFTALLNLLTGKVG
jgi:hypothetical protein